MNEPTITAEDLTLYALGLLEGQDAAQVEVLLRASSEAREELRRIRGDLALFALGAEQQAPTPLTRQRLLKQVARERRSTPIALPAAPEAGKQKPGVPIYVPDDPSAPEPSATRYGSGVKEPDAVPFTPPTVPTDLRQAPVARAYEAQEADRYDREDGPADPMADLLEWPLDRVTDRVTERATPRPPQPSRPVEPPRFGYARETEDAGAEDPSQGYTSMHEDEVKDRFQPSSFAFTSFETEEAEGSRGGVSRWFAWTGWAVAAALTAAGAFALRENFNLRRQVAFGVERVAQAEASAVRAQLVMQTLQSGATQRFVLAKTDAAPAPTGRVAYLPERGALIFQGSNLEPLAPYKTYELWLLPAEEGQQPVPAGTFKPDVRGYASVVLPQMPKGTMAKNFGVTIEDEGGASTPTLPIVMTGQQS